MRSGPLVVLVMSHKDPQLVNRLVGRLRTGTDVFVAVHHDPTGEPLQLQRASNVAAVPAPAPCRWGRADLAQAVLRSLRWVAGAVPEHSWVLLASGQDYPARSIRSIEDDLRTTPHDAFLRHFRLDVPHADATSWPARARRRYLGKTRVPFSARAVPMPRLRHPFRDGVGLYGGGLWFNLSREAVRQALGADELERRLDRFIRWSPIPDEMLLHTLLLNAAPHLDVVNDNRRYIRWDEGAPHPRVLEPADVEPIVASSAFFARKVDCRRYPEVLDRLDQLADNAA